MGDRHVDFCGQESFFITGLLLDTVRMEIGCEPQPFLEFLVHLESTGVTLIGGLFHTAQLRHEHFMDICWIRAPNDFDLGDL